MTPALYKAIDNCQEELASLAAKYPQFDFPYPICWFGDLETAVKSGKRIVLTMGINPSVGEFIGAPTHILHTSYTPQDLAKIYNAYFKQYPYDFFKKIQHVLKDEGELDVSYGGKLGQNDVLMVHIDLFPYATDPIWSKLPKEITSTFASAHSNALLKAIIDYAKPRLILSFGQYHLKIEELKKVGAYKQPNIPPYHELRKSGTKTAPGKHSIEIAQIFNTPAILTTWFPIYGPDKVTSTEIAAEAMKFI